MTKPIVQRLLVGSVVVRDNKVLIIQRSEDDETFPGFWELPGGNREPLETSEDAIVRETKEEAGLDVKVVKPLSVFEFSSEKEDMVRDVTQINFLVDEIGSVQPKVSYEHSSFAWVGVEELDKYNLSKETKEVIRLALQADS